MNRLFYFHITGLNRAFYSAPPAIVLHKALKARRWIERKACWDQNNKTPFAPLCPFCWFVSAHLHHHQHYRRNCFLKQAQQQSIVSTGTQQYRHTSAREENNRKADDLNKDSTNRIPKITCTDESRELCSKKGSQGFAHATAAAELTWKDTSRTATNSTCAPYKLINC